MLGLNGAVRASEKHSKKIFVKMLIDMHMVAYTWWCWHICKGEGVGVDVDQLGKEERCFGVLRTLGWLLEWNTALIHCALDQVFI